MSSPTLSVILPVRDGERYLSEAIDSVLSQTHTDFECIIIDDGSTDATPSILKHYASHDSRLRIITGPRSGIVDALNAGIAQSTAPYIARMDADDICLPTRFERQLAHLQCHPDCVLLGSRVLLIDADGSPIREWCSETTHDQIDTAHLEWGWPMVHPAVIMRRDALLTAGGYRRHYAHMEDLDLFLRLAEIGQIANLPEVLFLYRKHFASICQTKSLEQSQLRANLYRETRQRRGLSPEVAIPEQRGWRTWELHRLWGWWALQSGHLQTARKHATAAFRQTPFSLESWRLFYCAYRGH